MRVFFLTVCLCLSFVVAAQPGVDLAQTMKTMAFQYNKAYQSENSSDMLPVLQTLIDLTEQALQATFTADKAGQYQQGLQQVLAELQLAHAAASEQDIALAKRHLKQVESLRKDYHKLRKVSFWDLLFG
jgi:soluble cytochrome b562